jgi:hypothetical protein
MPAQAIGKGLIIRKQQFWSKLAMLESLGVLPLRG